MRIVRRARNIPNRIMETDNIILLLVGIGLGILIILASPRIVPQLQAGPNCTNLSHPSGGNNRSMLSFKGEDVQNLQVNVRLDSETIIQGEDLKGHIILQNRDIGPVILYIPNEEVLLGNFRPAYGPFAEVSVAIGGNPVWYIGLDQAEPPPVGGTYKREDLYLLQAREKCAVRFEITSAELNSVGIGINEYDVRGFYINSYAGSPDGIYPNQGVWNSGEIESEERKFTISQPPPPTAVQP